MLKSILSGKWLIPEEFTGIKERIKSLGSIGPRKYPCMFSRNCCFRVFASGIGLVLYVLVITPGRRLGRS